MLDRVYQAQQWLDQMPLRDNPERSASPSSETWQAWIERGKRLSNIAQTLGQILSSGSDPVTRSTAALALGFVGTTESITLLSAHLATDVPQVQMEAAAALGRLGANEAAEQICSSLQSPDSNVRANACMALGQIRTQEALACLNVALQDPDPFVRSAASAALGR